MGQAALKSCEICINSPGSSYCLNCCQYFCENCKSMHKRQTVTKYHMFNSGSNVVPEKNPKIIAELKDNIKSKLNEEKKILADRENGFQAFNITIESSIETLIKEGENLKAMIDLHVAEKKKSLTEKASLEKDKLSHIISERRKVLERCIELQQQIDPLQTAMQNSDLTQKLKTLMDEYEKLKLGAVPEFPSVKISQKTVADKEISQLLSSYTIRQTGETEEDSRRTLYLYSCKFCGTYEFSWKAPQTSTFSVYVSRK